MTKVSFQIIGCATQGMVYCLLVTTYLKNVDATKYCVADKGSGNRNEIRILVNWRYWLENDANSFAVGQPYGVAPIY